MILELFWEASITVQLVILILLGMSILSWHIIISKFSELNKRTKEIKFIHTRVVNSSNIIKEWQMLSKREGFFTTIMREAYDNLSIKVQKNDNSYQDKLEDKLEIMDELMEISIDREVQKIKRKYNILATIGSVSPYIGLFGTVYGIMTSFIALGESTSAATLESVAPGIAEALIATGIGLFAAIPAYIAFNMISIKIQEIEEEYNLLKEEFYVHTKKVAISKGFKING